MAARKGKRPKLGRPPGPPEQVRRNRLVLTLRDANVLGVPIDRDYLYNEELNVIIDLDRLEEGVRRES